MSLKSKLSTIGESFLRVPPLLIVDEVFRISFGFGGKILEYGARNLVIRSTARISSGEDLENNSTESNSCAFVNPFELYFNNKSNNDYCENSGGSMAASYDNNSHGDAISSTFRNIWANRILNAHGKLVDPGISPVALTSFFVTGKPEDYLLQFGLGDLSDWTQSMSWEVARAGEVLSCLTVFFAALIVLLLSTENLLKLYSQLLSVFALYAAYMIAPLPISLDLLDLSNFAYGIALRTLLAGVFFGSRNWLGVKIGGGSSRITSKSPNWTIFDTTLLSLFYLCGIVHLTPVVYTTLALFLQKSLWACVPRVFRFLKESWNETRRVQNEYGLSHLIQVECSRLRVNTVFRLFWISRAAYDASFRCCDESVAHIIRYVMSHGTETFTGIVGLTVTVSVICHSIGEFLLWILYWGTNSETDANRFGSISTVLFFILSLQTGLTSLDPEKRLDRLLKNIVLLGTALFHALHQMVAPLLHAFRTFQGLQIRAATISVAFLSISIYSTVYLLRFSSVSTWSLAVLALAIEFKIKIIISLVISVVVYLSQLVQYPEFLQKISNVLRTIFPSGITRLIDKLADQLSHEDVVFYLKSFANVGEFLTGIFLFVNAVWIFMFESASAIRAIGMTIHAYFNIWCEARKGWKIYCQRKTASMKIMSLADASDEQLASRKDDVCAICYEEMESAKVTLCGHLFHAVCLRKWLYVQNTCPLCHELLYGEDVLEELNRAQAGEGAVGGVGQIIEEVDEDDEDEDILENYPSTHLSVAQVLPQAQVVFTSGDDGGSDSSSRYRNSDAEQSSTEQQIPRSSNDDGLPRVPANTAGSPGNLAPNDVNNHVNINYNNANANPRSRGGLAVLL